MKTLLKQFLTLVIGIGLAITGSYVYAGTFTAPSGTPVTTFYPPVNTGTHDQVKDNGLSVDTFLAYTPSSLEQQAFFNGVIEGGATGPAVSTLAIGDINHVVNMLVSGSVDVVDSINSNTLVSAQTKTLCGSVDGTIIFCQ